MSDKLKLRVKLDDILQKVSNLVTSWGSTPSDTKYPSEKLVKDSLDTKAPISHEHNSIISYGQVDSTSTSTVFTATVPNITSLVDGTTVMLRNGVVTSASGFTINVNNLGAKPVYNSMADASADTTIFNINYTMLFVYDTSRVQNGCWICYRGYNSNDNTIGYQLRTSSQKMYATDKTYRYRLLLEVDDTHYMPVNKSTSISADVSKQSYMNTREFRIGGKILYYGYTSAINANAQFGATYHWEQYILNLGYSFNNTSSALELTVWSPVYMVAEPSTTNRGMAKLVAPYYTQTLPSTEDGKIYIYLGQSYSATNIELVLEHPVYEYKNGGIRLYNGFSTVAETGSYNDLTNKPTIPTTTSQLSNDGDGSSNKYVLDDNVKTINNQSILGTGNISISGGGNVDISLDTHSTNPVQNQAIANAFEKIVEDLDDVNSIYGTLFRLNDVYNTDELTGFGDSLVYSDDADALFYAKTGNMNQDEIATIGDIPSLTNYVQKSSTTGLLKNDGSVMTGGTGSSNYAVGNHTHTGTYANSSHNHNISDLNNVATVTVTVTYTDDTTENIQLLKYTGS